MNDNKNCPEIRFEGFSERWEYDLLGDMANFSKGRGYSKLDLVKLGEPIILYGRLYTHYQLVINDVDNYVLAKQGSIYSHGNEVIVPASGEAAEDIVRASAILNKGTILGGDLNIIYPNDDINSIFLALVISNGTVKKELVKKAQGKSVVHLRNADLKDANIYHPSVVEQQKIGTYFQDLDKLITQHQSKHNQLVNLKKAMLEKMFPKEGCDVPEIRFEGFDEAWEERRLGEIGSVAMNKRIFKNQTLTKGDIPFFKIGTFGSKPDAFISRCLFDEYKLKYPYPENGDIIISASGSIGRLVEYNGEDEYFQDSNIVWLKHDGRIVNSFLKQFYGIVKWFGLEGSTIQRLYNKNILETYIFLPTLLEQKKIGTYFQDLDKLIYLQKQQLEKLKNIKKACLDKMFV